MAAGMNWFAENQHTINVDLLTQNVAGNFFSFNQTLKYRADLAVWSCCQQNWPCELRIIHRRHYTQRYIAYTVITQYNHFTDSCKDDLCNCCCNNYNSFCNSCMNKVVVVILQQQQLHHVSTAESDDLFTSPTVHNGTDQPSCRFRPVKTKSWFH